MTGFSTKPAVGTGVKGRGGIGIKVLPENFEDFIDIFFCERPNFFFDGIGLRYGLAHVHHLNPGISFSGEDTPSSKIRAKKEPGVEEQKAVPDLAQWHIEESYGRSKEEKGQGRDEPGGEKASQEKDIDEDIGDEVVRTTDVFQTWLQRPLEEKANSSNERSGE